MIKDVVIKNLNKYEDQRGWLSEVYRLDETKYRPQMAYISVTKPGIVRGPHEHVYQSDCFVFVGPKRVPTEYEQEWLEIEKFPNVEIHPHVDHCELVRFIGESDALIIPYGTGNGTEFMLPAKVYEYVAWGKPIFCSRLYPEVSSVSGIFRVYDNESELCSLLKEEIARGFEVPDSIKKDCSDFLEMNTWDDRSVTLLELLGVR